MTATQKSNQPEQSRSSLRDTVIYEWPWARAFLSALLLVFIALYQWSSPAALAAVSALGVALLGIATGMKPKRKTLLTLLAAAAVAAVIGWLLPQAITQNLWLVVGVLFAVLTLGLRINHPYAPRLVRPRETYLFAGTSYTLPDIAFLSPRVFYIRPKVQTELMELATYADRFLRRNGIKYVMCYGTLLGALRHGGPMPWDDDVDFTIYRPQDLSKLEDDFTALAAEVEREGYQLFRHNDYWKIARRGFWRFPVVDLYRAAVAQPVEVEPVRMNWGGLSLAAPKDAEGIMKAYYGPDCLTSVVFSIPFWDSGFIPAAVARLLGQRLSNALGDFYDRMFK